MLKNLYRLFPAFALAAPLCAAEWMTDCDAALRKAGEENKLVLMDFTGSDWCGACIQMRQRVLDTPEFQAYADAHLVLLEVDLPRNAAKLGQEGYNRNQALVRRHGVSAYPTIVVLNAQGQTVGGFKGGKYSVQEVTAAMDKAAQNAAAVAGLPQLTGEPRLKALFSLYKDFKDNGLDGAAAEYSAILEQEDTTGTTPIGDEVADRNLLAAFYAAPIHNGTPEEQAEYIDRTVAACKTPDTKTTLLLMKMRMLSAAAQTPEDVAKARAALLQVAEVNPDARSTVESMDREMFSDPEAVLEKNRRAAQDSEDKAQAAQVEMLVRQRLASIQGKEASLAEVDRELAKDYPPLVKARLYALKATITRRYAQTTDDIKEAHGYMLRMADCQGEQAETFREAVNNMYADYDRVLQADKARKF